MFMLSFENRTKLNFVDFVLYPLALDKKYLCSAVSGRTVLEFLGMQQLVIEETQGPVSLEFICERSLVLRGMRRKWMSLFIIR